MSTKRNWVFLAICGTMLIAFSAVVVLGFSNSGAQYEYKVDLYGKIGHHSPYIPPPGFKRAYINQLELASAICAADESDKPTTKLWNRYESRKKALDVRLAKLGYAASPSKDGWLLYGLRLDNGSVVASSCTGVG